MAKYLLSIFFVAAMSLSNPIAIKANTLLELIENDYQQISITVTESTIRITGAAGQMLSIYDVAGVRVAYVKIDSSDKHFDFSLPRGCYIVKVGKVVRKVAIR